VQFVRRPRGADALRDCLPFSRVWSRPAAIRCAFGTMPARRAQSRFRRDIEANRADAFVHLESRWEPDSRQRDRRATSVHFERTSASTEHKTKGRVEVKTRPFRLALSAEIGHPVPQRIDPHLLFEARPVSEDYCCSQCQTYRNKRALENG